MTVCAYEGIDACPMEGFSAPKYDELLSLKEKNLTSIVVCPVGFRSESDKYGKLAKVRFQTAHDKEKSVDDFSGDAPRVVVEGGD